MRSVATNPTPHESWSKRESSRIGVRLHYSGLDRYGQPFERTVEGFHARVVQHEVDHLDGVLFPQRVQDMTRFGFEDALVGQMVPTPD